MASSWTACRRYPHTIGGTHRRIPLCRRENLRRVSSDGSQDHGAQIKRRASFAYCT
jgi:hypothetical protein